MNNHRQRANVRGLNLITDPGLYTGLGEAARGLRLAADAAGLAVTDVVLRYPSHQRTGDVAPAKTRPRQSVNVLAFNPQGLQAVGGLRMLGALRGRPTAAAWHWELEDPPDAWHAWKALATEIWAPTQFVQHALQRLKGPPVRVVPPAVGVPPVQAPARPVVPRFVCAFNPSSCVARKNPLGAIEAFRRAFGAHRDAAQLIIKTHDLAAHPQACAALVAAAQGLNCVWVDAVLTREAWQALLAGATAFVSLHRSEGFGLAMAEAMALGVPVLATRYGGSLDYMDDNSAALVDAVMRPITREDHQLQPAFARQYRPGRRWAEPILAHAAAWMQRLAMDTALSHALGAAGKKRVGLDLAPAAIGARMSDALRELARQPASIGRVFAPLMCGIKSRL